MARCGNISKNKRVVQVAPLAELEIDDAWADFADEDEWLGEPSLVSDLVDDQFFERTSVS
jgi:hypothetical protein